ncbi:MAG: Tol-Pal system protein TolB [Burkholderiaceae bacterium]|nr:Tol-Pal system protein TolB [Burkholderiaceae bacterium]
MLTLKRFFLTAATATFAVFGLLSAPLAQAQLRIEISGVGSTQIPIAIANFADEAQAPEQISAIIKADLTRSGYFKVIDTGSVMPENTSVNYSDWKARGAVAVVVGSVQRLADGRIDVRYRLFDTVKAAQLSGLSLAMPPDRARLLAHNLADDIYEKLTGAPGVFSTRIAYVTKSGREYRLDIADADGYNAIPARRSREPIISPSWSPDGRKVAYVTFEHQKPMIYVQDLPTGTSTQVANFKGNNSAPAWSPDGSRLAIALSLSGNTQIYMVNANGGSAQRLTNSSGIDTEPRFSPDGQFIYFTSDRSGGPQIYRMSVNGGPAQRVTFRGDYNISPRISPDGKTLAYISRRDNQFQLYTLDLAGAQELRMTDTAKDESPSFAANGRYVMYATSAGGHGTLGVVSIDGSVKYQLTTQAGDDIREPTWGPIMK